MLMRSDPFRELDRLSQQVFGTSQRPATMPMDAYRDGDRFVVEFDLPGVAAETIDVQVEGNAVTVRAERPATRAQNREYVIGERPTGTFTRQLFVGDTLDTEQLQATYDAGVLTVTIPVAEQAKPRRVAVTSTGQPRAVAS